MEAPRISVIGSTYANPAQLRNLLWTLSKQTCPVPFEVLIADNASPGPAIAQVCADARVGYLPISPADKKGTNISQGINLAARAAKGDWLAIIADTNVLLSFNLLSAIASARKPGRLILSRGGLTDVKISPLGTRQSEYARLSPKEMARENDALLVELGWPCDPLRLRLQHGKHRFPPPHAGYDCYLAALERSAFLASGGYQEGGGWGTYHQSFLQSLASRMEEHLLSGVRIVHQYHRVYKEEIARERDLPTPHTGPEAA